jgi:hypothetical protein
MKQITLLLALTIGSLFAQAQSKDTALNRRITEFMQTSRDMDIDRSMDYIYPRIFEVAPRSLMVEEMKKAFTSEEMSITMDSVRAMKAEPITVAGTTQFTRFQYYVKFRIRFNKKDSTEEDMAASYLELFKAQFGKQNVTYSGETDIFHIQAIKYSLAIKDRYSKNIWTFVNQEQSKMLRKLMPAALVKKYKM